MGVIGKRGELYLQNRTWQKFRDLVKGYRLDLKWSLTLRKVICTALSCTKIDWLQAIFYAKHIVKYPLPLTTHPLVEGVSLKEIQHHSVFLRLYKTPEASILPHVWLVACAWLFIKLRLWKEQNKVFNLKQFPLEREKTVNTKMYHLMLSSSEETRKKIPWANSRAWGRKSCYSGAGEDEFPLCGETWEQTQ